MSERVKEFFAVLGVALVCVGLLIAFPN